MLTPWKYTACKWTFHENWLECFIWSMEVCCSHIKKAVWYGGQIIKIIKIRKLIWIFSLCVLWFILYCMFFISCPVFMFPNLFSWKHQSVISFVVLELSNFVPVSLFAYSSSLFIITLWNLFSSALFKTSPILSMSSWSVNYSFLLQCI